MINSVSNPTYSAVHKSCRVPQNACNLASACVCKFCLIICGPGQAHLQDRIGNLSKLVCNLQFEDLGIDELANFSNTHSREISICAADGQRWTP